MRLMHDPKFEKEVQQKMEALEFSPSDAVWLRLEQDLKKKKRRSVPLLWLFFLVGGMLLGAGGTWLFFSHNEHSGSSRSGISLVKDASKPTGSMPIGSAPIGSASAASASASASAGSTPAGSGSIASSPIAMIPGASSSRSRQFGSRQSSKDQVPANDLSHTTKTTTRSDLMARNETRARTETMARNETMATTNTTEATETINFRSEIRTLPSAIQPGFSRNIASEFPTIGTGSRKDLTRTLTAKPKVSSAKKATLNKTAVWEAGFTGGSGISSLTSGVNQQTAASATPSALNGYYPAYPFARFAAAPVTGFTPKIQPDLSFWAGVFVQKPILKKLSLSVGLNLHYYSARVSTGQQIISNSPNAAATLFTSSVVVAAQTFPFYSPGDSHNFLNRYYFLELPVSLQWQFNRGRQIPFFLEGGVSAARLMGANAIYYDQAQGIYHKDATPSNSFRLFASAALMAGLHWRGANIQLGPQFQYGLGSLLNGSAGAGQHLLYGGIKITVIPGRR
jgi:hypothetical protein